MAEKKVATVQQFFSHYAKMLGYTKLLFAWSMPAIRWQISSGAEYYF
ncbi:hypothetical protein [Pseudoalteromonas 'SMAR']